MNSPNTIVFTPGVGGRNVHKLVDTLLLGFPPYRRRAGGGSHKYIITDQSFITSAPGFPTYGGRAANYGCIAGRVVAAVWGASGA